MDSPCGSQDYMFIRIIIVQGQSLVAREPGQNWGTHGVTGEVEMSRKPHGEVSMMASAYTRVYQIPFVDPVYPH